MGSPLRDRLAPRIVAEDGAWRAKMAAAAEGLSDIIVMGAGDPDLPTPTHVVEAAKAALDAGAHHYTPPAGMPTLREAIAAMLHRDYGLDYSADEVVVTAGVQESVMLLMLALVAPGDEVLVTSPRFTTYDTACHMCGGTLVPVPTHQKDGFALDPSEVEARITPRTRLFVLTSPNNPTGGVTPPEAIRAIAEICVRHDILLVSDEIYAGVLFDGAEHLSAATLPGLKERTITLNGFSKTYAMTGWRVGYMAAPADFVAQLIEPKHALSINTCTVSQHAALAALTGPQEPIRAMVATYADRRALLLDALRRMGLSFAPPMGGLYVYPDVTPTGLGAEEFCLRLLREAQVLINPGGVFGDTDDRHIRMSFLQPIDRLEIALGRMAAFIDSLKVPA
ncbi:pyridoxal phosphate-dependent aminotransferase [Ponticoccus sp. SC2-23]|uniref:pyridoxal phosphate-dependent aminotransferase n=1 Tax=Alexandriicola marinus TaxID=2081710 RepID=UPI000FDA096E|nr:pyridoxal phosphate-dependent aminotransferase [Alexandriicola marinus]MBM1219796.1 pyridoxal phosphate-dependent aminotransferase [Ponticoccus sp. SC6-9]MBM1223132.1 pyridoxal phosphate-dependent aminotransferase [Ponticoccus sp. SC6-15]MBM1229609.1 pyridoxal phosphate-dependent aminotransferase [Ponticoccus sp. SC6-38]MBM1232098.1 pyridoxal phosphate-dependent aminotransferase [Ponticoccus sp. SC6-45]MBM1237952.1 pyridoxal phosphate-dependent aminotransferase [Ponticoccus sp. SC6-49]MBM1